MNDISEQMMVDFHRFPAIPDSCVGDTVYFLKAGRKVATGRIGSRYMGEVTVYLTGDDSLAYFKNDHAVKVLGKHAPFRFFQHSGWPVPAYSDEPKDRLEGISVVSGFDLDFGFASTLRYADVEGFGEKLQPRTTKTISGEIVSPTAPEVLNLMSAEEIYSELVRITA